ncbi:signal peptidase I [Saxibacter everestensis]|uniref:Signal peptidase I n=1 Tax=Saxibacter everestensis TaxID=2909229 RepID=A0ABY8QXG3_9MICO|nr:signal peptidase I [Brevibacteriaceae bacterium ZFBP1038]
MARNIEAAFADELARFDRPSPRVRVAGWLRELAFIVVAALLLSVLFKLFLVRAFYIPSASMESTLDVDDRILVNQLSPGLMPLERGDIVVFNDPGGWLPETEQENSVVGGALTFIGLLPQDAGEQVVKRVIGLPGDRIECCSADGNLIVNGQPIREKYVHRGSPPSDIAFDVEVPDDRIWVMGDNRSNSADSRYHMDQQGHGTIPVSSVVGTVFVINWPLERFRWISNPADVFAHVPES